MNNVEMPIRSLPLRCQPSDKDHQGETRRRDQKKNKGWLSVVCRMNNQRMPLLFDIFQVSILKCPRVGPFLNYGFVLITVSLSSVHETVASPASIGSVFRGARPLLLLQDSVQNGRLTDEIREINIEEIHPMDDGRTVALDDRA